MIYEPATFEPVRGPGESVPALRQVIKVVKPSSDCGILPNRKAQAMQRIENIASELGRMQKLLDELRADVLHLTIE